MLKNSIRLLTAAALLTSLTGCWSMAINGAELTKPVSMSNSIGRPVTVSRHFKHDMLVTWYLLGLVPMASMPGASAPFATPADRLVSTILKNELQSGDGITNLRVTHGITLPAAGIMIVLGIVPVVGPAASTLFSPRGVTIEGDVVTFSGKKGALPTGPVITEQNGELDMAGVDLRGMIDAALQAEASTR